MSIYSSVYEHGSFLSQTQNLRESLATQEPISDGKCGSLMLRSNNHIHLSLAAAMSNPYQPSPQPNNDEI